MSLVYFARRADGQGPIKIGCSSCPKGRLLQLSIDCRMEFAVLALAPGGFMAERNLHLKFAHLRTEFDGVRVTRGGYTVGAPTEWFLPTPELLAYVDQVNSTGVIALSHTEQRENVFAERYLAGATLQSIADDYGITRERVRQILRKTGIKSLGLREQHKTPSHRLTPDEIAAVRLYQRGTPPKEIAKLYPLTRSQIARALKQMGFSAKGVGHWNRCPGHDAVARKVVTDYIARVRAALSQPGVTRGGLAKKAGLHRNTLNHAEADGWNPTATVLTALEPHIEAIERGEWNEPPADEQEARAA